MAPRRNSNGSDPGEVARRSGFILDRLPPQNPEAEEAVLGSCLMDPDAIFAIPYLKPEMFFRERNGAIFASMLALKDSGTPVDFLTVTDELKRCGRYEEVGGLAHLSHLIGVVPTSVHVEHYAKIVERTYVSRMLISAAGKIAAVAYDDSMELQLKLSRVHEIVGNAAVSQADRPVYAPDDLADMFLLECLRIEEEADKEDALGLMTGTRLDRFLHGLKPGKVYVIAARPGMGKSTFAQGIADYVAGKGKQVFLATAEMTAIELLWRKAAKEVGLDPNEIQKRIHKKDPSIAVLVQKIHQAIRNMGISIFDAAGMTSTEIRAKAARMRRERGLHLIVIDYLQRLADASAEDEEGSDVKAISRVSSNICDMAKALDVPVLLVSQLSRACELRPDKRPILSDLRGSGSIEQDAYAVLFIYRDEKYNKKSSEKGIAEIAIAKNRGGTDGIILRFAWRPDVQQYADYEPEYPDQPPPIETFGEFQARKKGQRQQ